MSKLTDPKHTERWKKEKERIKKLRVKQINKQKDYVAPLFEANVKIADEGLITFLGDIHIGHESINWIKLERDIKLIQDYGIYVVGMGDYIDNFNARATDKKISTDERLRDQKELAKDILEDIQYNLLGLLLGNHEHRSKQTDDFDVVGNWLTQELKVNDLGHMSTINASTKGRTDPLTLFVSHEWKGSSWHSPTYCCKKARRDYPHLAGKADIVAIGHNHLPAIEQLPIPFMGLQTNIRTGAYVMYDDYSQKLRFLPTHNYIPTVYYNNETVIAFMDIQHAVDFYRGKLNIKVEEL